MSESMTSVEIEDVLSSIRRLVSEDLRPTHKLVSAALQQGASKLILTPALRIVSDVRYALPERTEGQSETRDLKAVLHEIEEGDSEPSADIMPMFGSVRLNEPLVLKASLKTKFTENVTSDSDFLTTAMSRINGLSAGETRSVSKAQSDTIEAVVATVGAAVGPDEWEPDGGEPAPDTQAWPDTAWTNSDIVENAVRKVEASEDLLLTESVARSGDAQQTVAYDLQAETILQQASAAESGQSIGHDTIVSHDIDVPDAETLLFETPVDLADHDDLDDTAPIISEELLREIVRDMIRDELQGTLGERITHNVRKLVRAEISRALASRDFDDMASRG